MAVSATGSASNVPFVQPDQVGFAGLTSESFLKLLITELQNQDPLEPLGNDELLSQLSMMRNLQSSIELSSTLKSLTGSQELSTASSFIGKSVTGMTAEQEVVSGIADRVFMSGGKVFLSVNGNDLPLSQVTGISQAE